MKPEAANPQTHAAKVDAALAQLDMTAPYIAPADIAPLFGVSQSAIHKHCQKCPATAAWNRGQYRFQTDDAGHVAILRALLGRILKSGRRLPSALGRTVVKRG